jgi:hypothetical protein
MALARLPLAWSIRKQDLLCFARNCCWVSAGMWPAEFSAAKTAKANQSLVAEQAYRAATSA